MNFITKNTIDQIISKTEEISSDIFFNDIIEDGNFKIIGVRKKTGRYYSAPIVKSKQKSEVRPGASWELLKESTIVNILRTIQNEDFATH